MSRHYYSHSSELEQIQHDFNTMVTEDFEHAYGVQLIETGGVFDPLDNKTYRTFGEWATAQIQEEDNNEQAHPQQVSRRFEE